MASQQHDISHRWSLVLAGGEGERTRPFIEQWLGYHKPKQFCAFIGTRSMLQHTWSRADQLTLPEQKVTVVARHHAAEISAQMMEGACGQVISQPHNCDTAAGIFLPLTYIRSWDPQATVIIYPSDHFVFPENRFVETVRAAIGAAAIMSNRIMLLGVRPTCLELEYGWIEPGVPLGWSRGSRVHQVQAFLEKPDALRALAALSAGALWNTFVLAAKVETLWQLGWQHLSEVMKRFEVLGHAIGTSSEKHTLEMIYEDMPKRNFSSDLLQCIPERVGVLEMQDVMWSDWGHPARIRETLRAIDKEPAFPCSRKQSSSLLH